MGTKEIGGPSEPSDSANGLPSKRSSRGNHNLGRTFDYSVPDKQESQGAFISTGPKHGGIPRGFNDLHQDRNSDVAKADKEAPDTPTEPPRIPKDLPTDVRETAERLDSALHELANAENEISLAISETKFSKAEELVASAREYALTALDGAIRLAELTPSTTLRISVDAIRAAEDRLGIPAGTFDKYFGRGGKTLDNDRRVELKALLAFIREGIANAPIEKAPRRLPAWLAPTLSITSAVLVAAAVGAPLAALAVGEPVVKEFIKTGIATTVVTVADPVIRSIIQRWSRRHDQPGPERVRQPTNPRGQKIRDQQPGKPPPSLPTTTRMPPSHTEPAHNNETYKPSSNPSAERRIPGIIELLKLTAHKEPNDPFTNAWQDTPKVVEDPDPDPPSPDIDLGI